MSILPERPLTAEVDIPREDLTDAQADGVACVLCGRDLTGAPSVPLGVVAGGQVFACSAGGCAVDEPAELDEPAGPDDCPDWCAGTCRLDGATHHTRTVVVECAGGDVRVTASVFTPADLGTEREVLVSGPVPEDLTGDEARALSVALREAAYMADPPRPTRQDHKATVALVYSLGHDAGEQDGRKVLATGQAPTCAGWTLEAASKVLAQATGVPAAELADVGALGWQVGLRDAIEAGGGAA